jgi:hypothetical protein
MGIGYHFVGVFHARESLSMYVSKYSAAAMNGICRRRIRGGCKKVSDESSRSMSQRRKV